MQLNGKAGHSYTFQSFTQSITVKTRLEIAVMLGLALYFQLSVNNFNLELQEWNADIINDWELNYWWLEMLEYQEHHGEDFSNAPEEL